jgi:hypothetical protein
MRIDAGAQQLIDVECDTAMINSIPRRLIFSKQSGFFHSICALHQCLRGAIVMVMLWPIFAAAESGRLPQTLAFTQKPIAFWSQLYHCVLTAAEFRKALKNRTLVNAVHFSSTDVEETRAVTASATPSVQPTPSTAPPPLAAIPILAQMLPPIADITIPAPAAGNDGANSPVTSMQSPSDSPGGLAAPDAPSNRAAVGRLRGTPALEADDSGSNGPIVSYPISKAKLADIKARETRLGLPVASRGLSAAALKNGFVDKQTGY